MISALFSKWFTCNENFKKRPDHTLWKNKREKNRSWRKSLCRLGASIDGRLLYMTEFSGILMGSQLLFALRKKWEQTEKLAKLLKLYWRTFNAVLVYQSSTHRRLDMFIQGTLTDLPASGRRFKGAFRICFTKFSWEISWKSRFLWMKQSKSLARNWSEFNSYFIRHANSIWKLKPFLCESRSCKDGWYFHSLTWVTRCSAAW